MRPRTLPSSRLPGALRLPTTPARWAAHAHGGGRGAGRQARARAPRAPGLRRAAQVVVEEVVHLVRLLVLVEVRRVMLARRPAGAAARRPRAGAAARLLRLLVLQPCRARTKYCVGCGSGI
jgi:hypothetical protein